MNTALTPELEAARLEIEGFAREYGLDFFETIFEVLDSERLNEVAAYGGFPTRYPHWRFGMEYNQLEKGYSYGISKIYELVINNDPCYAYLMRSNAMVDQKLVMAHVYGHCDFFKNNLWFSKTDRHMMDRMANHNTVIRRWVDRLGLEIVEDFLDRCLSLDNLIDPHSMFIKRRVDPNSGPPPETDDDPPGFRGKAYMDGFVNPRKDMEPECEPSSEPKSPPEPQRDVLLYLLENAPVEDWQAEILEIIHQEAYYFAPQAMTKIMNEGWASYWHAKMMTERILGASDVVDYADHHSGTMVTTAGRLNPYKLGIELFRDIKHRWDHGKFGIEYEECDDSLKRQRWNRDLGQGNEKIFEVRRTHNDITFLDTFLNADFCEAQKLFVYEANRRTGQYEIVDRDWRNVRSLMLSELTNWGQPFIYVADGNYENRKELLLQHRWNGNDLQMDVAADTLKNLSLIWGRPVHLETQLEEKGVLLTCSGPEGEVTSSEIGDAEETRVVGQEE